MSDETTPDIRELREAAERGRVAEAKAEALQRENLAIRAGIDIDSRLGKMFLENYKGELTVDAVKADALDLGILKTAAPDTTAADEDADMQRQRQQMSGGRATGAAGNEFSDTPNPYDTGYAEFHELMSKGVSRDRAGLALFDRVFAAGVKGDPRVRFNQSAWLQAGALDDEAVVVHG